MEVEDDNDNAIGRMTLYESEPKGQSEEKFYGLASMDVLLWKHDEQ